jgi:leucyl-tRNA synthetase
MLVQENLDLFKEESHYQEDVGIEKKAKLLIIRTHQTIKKVTEDIEKRYHLNTAISTIMELYNHIKKEKDELRQSEEGKDVLKKSLETLVLLLSPFAPHICEELWERMEHKTYIIKSSWPAFDPTLALEERVIIVVQINGKLRGKFEAERDIAEDQAKEKALGLSRIQDFIGEKKVKKIIYIKNKLVNIVL